MHSGKPILRAPFPTRFRRESAGAAAGPRRRDDGASAGDTPRSENESHAQPTALAAEARVGKGALHPALRAALLAGAAGAGGLAAFGHRSAAFGWACGVGWNVLNIRLLERMALLLGPSESSCRRRLIVLLLCKFLLLYPAAVLLLWSESCPAAPFAAGFTAVLGLVAVGAARRLPWGRAHA